MMLLALLKKVLLSAAPTLRNKPFLFLFFDTGFFNKYFLIQYGWNRSIIILAWALRLPK